MTQSEAIDTMLAGHNVFLTGAPGAGKTYTLTQFIEQARDRGRKVAVTASTGMAASHLNGTTIHSWSGTGILEVLAPADITKITGNGRIRKRYEKTDTLIIDEVSMLHGYRLNMVDQLARKIRKKPRPFGGMQVMLVGDLFQLPPVTRGSNVYDFVHRSQAWAELMLKVCYITEQHRQAGEDQLLELLVAMRADEVTERQLVMLGSRRLDAPPDVTKLFTHNADVDTLNQRELAKLTGESKKYLMQSGGDERKVITLRKNVLAPERLELKVGAEVMFVANNFQEGYVNGTRGTITAFRNDDPVVKLKTGGKIVVTEHQWAIKDDNDEIEAFVLQIPLRLAWAITVHKSQGMSLDSAEIDLTNAFQPGMGYVALSRVRSLDGLFLKGFNGQALKMHEEVFAMDRQWLEASNG